MPSPQAPQVSGAVLGALLALVAALFALWFLASASLSRRLRRQPPSAGRPRGSTGSAAAQQPGSMGLTHSRSRQRVQSALAAAPQPW